MRCDFDQQRENLAAEIPSGMKEWRPQHPRATLKEIEAALDERLFRPRARMLEDAALASAAADWREREEAPPVCPLPFLSNGAGRSPAATTRPARP